MNREEKQAIFEEMESKGIIRASLKKNVSDHFKNREEEDTRFCCLMYDVQEKIEDFLKKR